MQNHKSLLPILLAVLLTGCATQERNPAVEVVDNSESPTALSVSVEDGEDSPQGKLPKAKVKPSTGFNSTAGARASNDKPAAPVPASEVVKEALVLVGTPYRWGGSSPQTGFDCSGFLNHVFGDTGISLPRSSRDMAVMKKGVSVPKVALKKGDLLFFSSRFNRRIDHAAIYIGQNQFVHAPARGGKVRVDNLDEKYWKRAFRSAKRVL